MVRRFAQEKLARFQANIDRQKTPLRQLLNTPDGLVLMRELEQLFIFGDLLGDSPEETAFNLGAREVVMRLRALRDFNPGQEGK